MLGLLAGVGGGGSLIVAAAADAPLPAAPRIDASGMPASADATQRQAWSETFAVLVRQADAGSWQASCLALEMVQYGPRIYGMPFEASEWQLKRWRLQRECGRAPCVDHG